MSVSSADAQSTTTAPEPNGTSLITSRAVSTPRLASTKRTDALANSAGSYARGAALARAGAKNCSTCGGSTGGAEGTEPADSPPLADGAAGAAVGRLAGIGGGAPAFAAATA